jgi:hypothetical protein
MTNPADFYTSYADRFKLLGHPMRLLILDALRRTPECVCHLEALNVYLISTWPSSGGCCPSRTAEPRTARSLRPAAVC